MPIRTLLLLFALLLLPACPGGDDDDSAGDDDDATADDDDATADDDDATADDDDSAGDDDDDSAGDDDDSAGDDDDSAPVDADSDGVTSDLDCDDADPAVFPGAVETCDDAVDNDCDATTDCQGACAVSWQYDGACTASTYAGPNPVLLWGFDDSSDLLADTSGNGYHGTNDGGTWADVAGWLGTSASLSSSARASAAIGEPVAWTSTQWINLDNLPTDDFAFIASNGNGTTSWTGWTVGLTSAGLPMALTEGGSSVQEVILTGPSPVCVGGWVHLAARFDQTTLDVFVDGVSVASTVPGYTVIPPGGLPFVVGWDENQDRRAFDGKLDDVAVFGSALSDAEILAIAHDGFCGFSL